MWYKHFNRETWFLRIWRWQNLKFRANDFSVTKVMGMSKMRIYIFKIFRTDASVKSFNAFFIAGLFMLMSYVNRDRAARQAAEAEHHAHLEEKREREAYRKEFLLNRYGLPTRPLDSMESFLSFLTNMTAIKDVLEFFDNAAVTKINDDRLAGLDAWIAAADREYQDKEHGHH